MRVTTERLEDCQVNVIVELDAAEVDKRLRQTARTISRQYTVPGYRRGKAPLAAVIRTFGREVVQEQAIEDWGQELYEKALEEIEYQPFETGMLQEVEWDPFRMTILLPIMPEVDLGDYRAVRAPYEVEPVTEEQIEEYLAGLQQEHGQWVPVDRPAAMGDQVVLDFEGKAGDELIMSKEEHEMLLDEGAISPLPGFHEEIVGMSPGEEKSFVLPVPEEDTDERAAGQDAAITVRLHTVKAEDLPPLDDELAMMVGDYASLDDMKTSVRERLETDALQRTESEYLDKALEALVEAAVKIEYPPQAVDQEMELALNQMERNLASSGIQLDTYLGMIGKTRESYKQDLRPAAEGRLKKRLVLNEIGKREELTVEPEKVEAEIDRMSEMMGDRAEEMREMLDSPAGRMSIADDLMVAKVQELVVQIARGETPSLEEERSGESPAEAEEAEAEPEAGEPGVEETEEAVEAGTEVDTEAEAEPEAGEPAAEAQTGAEEESAKEPESNGAN